MGWNEEFDKFFGYLLLFAFISMFWSGFKADMAKRNNISAVAEYKPSKVQVVNQQPTYRRVYVNNNYGGPATVYYVRQ
ncbi:MAG: hypothetical protein WC933_01235 [Candidatus Paceibacterota bacterium]|jgi:hypothetical protein